MAGDENRTGGGLPIPLPLPLGQLHLRARNGKNPLERHQAAFFLWEAGLKLLGSVLVLEYASAGGWDPELQELLQGLARPSPGSWWELTRRLLPVLAEDRRKGEAFRRAHDFLLGAPREDLPRAAALDAVLREVLDSGNGARSAVRPGDLFHGLIRYGNRECGRVGPDRLPGEETDGTGRAIFEGITELWGRVDVLLGRRLIHISDVRRQATGAWLVERFELMGEQPRRLESLEMSDSDLECLPRPGRVYLEGPDGDSGNSSPHEFHSLHPLVLFHRDSGEFFFLRGKRGNRRPEYICYPSGRVADRHDLDADQRELLQLILNRPVGREDLEDWRAQGMAAEPVSGQPVSGEQAPPGMKSPARRIGEFELLSEIGRGGPAVVYRAWQPSLGRVVALKCLLESLGDGKIEARLSREVQSLCRVEHPHLVKVFSSGLQDDRWFCAMELVEGADLSSISGEMKEIAAREEPFSITRGREKKNIRPGGKYIERVVELLRQAAGAAHALHEAGILHRDIKPGNIMVASGGDQAVLMEPGLFRLAGEVRGRPARTGQLPGAVRYGSPEQLQVGGSVDRRSDVYSLGATLWELLTLQPLFGGPDELSLPELKRRINSDRPESPRTLNPLVPPALEAIVLRCLEKDRTRRYATAADLAGDLGRWQRGEPVNAQPPSLSHLIGYSLRRRKERSILAGSLVFLVLLGLAAYFLVFHEDRRETGSALFDLYTTLGLQASEEGNASLAAHWFSSAATIPRIDPLRREANRIRLQSWSSRIPLPVRAFMHQGQKIEDIAFHPGGRYLLVLARGGECTIWDLVTEEDLVLPEGCLPATRVIWSPGGERIVLGGPGGSVKMYRFPAWEPLARMDHSGSIRALAFSRDGRLLALAGNTVQVWDCRSNRPVTPDLPHPGPIHHVSFNRRGDRILTHCGDRVRVFTLAGEESGAGPLFDPVTAMEEIEPRFLEGGQKFLTATTPSEVTLWDAGTGASIRTILLQNSLGAIAVGAGGRFFAICEYGGARIWDAALDSPLGPRWRIPGWVVGAEFNPDGSTLMTASTDGVARIWSFPPERGRSDGLFASTTRQVAAIPHEQDVLQIAHSPEGRYLATARADGLVRIWRPGGENPGDYRNSLEIWGTEFAISPDGSYFMPVRESFSIQRSGTRACNVATGDFAGPPLGTGGILTGGVFSPDGTHALLLLGGEAGGVQFWNWRTGEMLYGLETDAGPAGAAYSPGGDRAALACDDGSVFLIDSAGGETREMDPGESPNGEGLVPDGILFSPDGKSLISRGGGGSLRVWDANTGQLRPSYLENPVRCEDLDLSADGRLLLTISGDSRVEVRDFSSARLLAQPLEQGAPVFHAEFDPGGNHLLAACEDNRVRIWDWRAGRLACPTLENGVQLRWAAFLPPRGRWVITVDDEVGLRAWEWQTGKPVMPPRPLADQATQVLVASSGSHVLVSSPSTLHVFCMDEQLAPAGGNLDSENYDPSVESVLDWHRWRAGILAQELEWEAAAWHLDRLGENASKTDRALENRLQEFVRAWRFAAVAAPLGKSKNGEGRSVRVEMDARRLEAIEESALSSRLIRFRGPYIDFRRPLSQRTSHVAGYAARVIQADRAGKVNILAGADDALRIWINGNLVLETPDLPVALPDLEVATARLAPGRNMLVVEVTQLTGNWGMYLRFEDPSGRRLRLTDEGRLVPLVDPE